MKRDAFDRYYTPAALARELVGVLSVPGRVDTIIEPSVGSGAFAAACRARWPDALILGVDVDPAVSLARLDGVVDDLILGDWPLTALSLLGEGAAPIAIDLVVSNPPYRHAERHVGVALAAGRNVAMLLRLGFLAGQKRGVFWREHPPSEVFVLSKRPSFTADGRTDGSEYGWFVWYDPAPYTRQVYADLNPPALRWHPEEACSRKT